MFYGNCIEAALCACLPNNLAGFGGSEVMFLFMTRRHKLRDGIHEDLVSLVLDFADRKCSNVHDRVYGMLGLARDGSSFEVKYLESVESLLSRIIARGNVTDIDDIRFLERCFGIITSD